MAAGKTYEPISTTTVSGTPTSVSLSPPSTYTDLKIVVWHSTAFADNLNARFNSDTAANYRYQLYTQQTASVTNTTYIEFNYGDAVNSSYDIDILNYNNAVAYKGVQARIAPSSWIATSTTATWNGTAAITDILLRIGAAGTQTFPNGTLITLFGIKAA